MATIEENLISILNSKKAIKSALIAKGQNPTNELSSFPTNISNINKLKDSCSIIDVIANNNALPSKTLTDSYTVEEG